jgi:hypothetical protein
MKLRHTFLILGLLHFGLATAQNISISGTIKDGETGETLLGVNIYDAKAKAGTVSNEYGFYSITVPRSLTDTAIIVYSYTGYAVKTMLFLPQKDTVINIEMGTGVDMDVVVVEDGSPREQLNSTQMGKVELTAEEAKKIPVIFGEVDILKVLQLKPGVQSGGEGNSGLYVRGGGSDQNLFILDEAQVYNPSHLFGFFSTFNADAIKNVTLYKAGFPAEYGGKLSSVIDVSMREGNRKKFKGAGGLGLISSRLTLEGPLKKDKGAFIVSGRRTYVDVITRIINKTKENDPEWTPLPDYNFFDLNAKFNYDLGDKDKLFLSGYWGKDYFTFKNESLNFNFNWGNVSSTLRWNHIISPKLFVNTSFTFSDYVYKITTKFDQFGFEIGSGIRDMNLKADFDWFPNNKHAIKFGANAIYHRFSVNRFDAGSEDGSLDFELGNIYHAGEYALYFGDDWTINNRLKINLGGRASAFTNEGAFYYGLEPRLAMKYSLTENLSLKANYSRMYQYLHLVSSSGASLPTDVWYPSTRIVKPQYSDLVSLGLGYALKNDFYFSLEGYYKWLHNQIDFRDGAQLVANDNLDTEFVFGKGSTYGVEAYVEKKRGQWTGWVGYTLSWSWRIFPDIMNGQRFRPRYDRRHDASVVVMYEFKNVPITLSATWVYGTGNAVSLPVARYFHTDVSGENPFSFVPVFTERNGFRMPAYHRMDLGMVWQLFPKKDWRMKSDLTISIYNVYSRLNTFFLFIEPQYANRGDNIPTSFQAKSVALFPIIPTITWNFKF